jgi:uncharacterized iron-regulated membrane protein
VNTVLHRWHRIIGLGAAGLLVLLAITGIALAYDVQLQLDRRFITSAPLLDWYAIRPAPPPIAYRTHEGWVTQSGTRLYLDHQLLADRITKLQGALAVSAMIVLAVDDELWFLDQHRNVVDKLSTLDGLPPAITAIGISEAHSLAVRADTGDYLVGLESLVISPQPLKDVSWAQMSTAPAPLQAALAADYRGSQLSLERLILDLHTGRILGVVGVAIVNLSALAMIVLAASGVLAWSRRRRRMRRRVRAH